MVQISEQKKREELRDTRKRRVGEVRLDMNLVLIVLYSLMPLVDSLNGFLLRKGFSLSLSIGDLYRIGVIALMLALFLSKIKQSYMFAFASVVAYGLIAILLHVAIRSGDVDIPSEVNMLTQLLLGPLLVLSLLTAVDNRIIEGWSFDRILDNLQWIAPLTIFIPYLLGVGYSTYSASEGDLVGYKGFYYATNGISFMLIALFARAVFQFLSARSIHGFTIVVINGASLALIGTKSALAMLIIAFLIAIYSIYGSRFLKTLGALMFLGIVVAIIWFFAADIITSFLSPILNRWYYLSSKLYQGDIAAALTSGRINQIGAHWDKLVSFDNQGVSLLVGMGDTSNTIQICEMDFFDVFFQFGLIGLLLLILFVGFVLRRAWVACGNRGFEVCMLVFFLAYSFVVGHVFNNALSSMVFALFAVAAMTRNNANSETVQER